MPMSAFTGKQSKAFRFKAGLTPCRPMHRDGVLSPTRQAYTTPIYFFKIKNGFRAISAFACSYYFYSKLIGMCGLSLSR